MQAGDKIINNNGEADFMGEVSFIEDGLAYFEVEDDQYWSPVASATLCGHINGRNVWKATTYNG